MQTLTVSVSPAQIRGLSELKFSAILIPPYYWHWWPRWCRRFVIRGRVVCADGSPVPGAKVCALDVDWWWWWISKTQVGCAVTDASGSFEISFTWCCGYWPWWWWRTRVWQRDPFLAKLILPLLERSPTIPRIPLPDPQPDISIFNQILDQGAAATRSLATAPSTKLSAPNLSAAVNFDPASLDALRPPLLARLPASAELERLRVWPWWPWRPWTDCSPDIIFNVTQNCNDKDVTIVSEGLFEVRWDVPTQLDVTLTANKLACCLPGCQNPGDCPEGDCIVISRVCDDVIKFIGGNPGAPATPAGYLNPNVLATTGDRPYGGGVLIAGLFGSLAHVDYYEFEIFQGAWNAMPVGGAVGFSRTYWGPKLGGGPVDFYDAPFPITTIGGRNVIESREHFEANNDPANWGLTRFWVSNWDLLIEWLSETFNDGTYQLRVRSWKLADLMAGGNLANSRILPLCDTKNDNGVTIAIDNRFIGPDVPGVCGAGTVHLCTTEPDTGFISVKILDSNFVEKTDVGACGKVDLAKGDILEIVFKAYDQQGGLASFGMLSTYGNSLAVDLLPIGTLAPAAPSGTVPAASQVGPSYGEARAQGAVAPVWTGGTIRLRVPAVQAFPETCCYQLQLTASKRTVVNCDHNFEIGNLSEYSFMVVV